MTVAERPGGQEGAGGGTPKPICPSRARARSESDLRFPLPLPTPSYPLAVTHV